MVGSIPDSSVHEHFSYTQIPGAKNETSECLRCHRYKKARNTSRQKAHLLDHCPEYKDWLIANGRENDIKLPTPRTSQVNGGAGGTRSSGASGRGAQGASSRGNDAQSEIGGGGGSGLEDFQVQTNFTTAQKRRIDEKLALAMYATGQQFSLFEDPLWTDFFKELGYVVPARQTLVEICLMRVRTAARGGGPVRPFQSLEARVAGAVGPGAPGAGGPVQSTLQFPPVTSAQSTPVPAQREPVLTTPVLSNAAPDFGMQEY
ncbi:MAG: hypothetical protein M1818_002833 [Claussenomyces sp. TS43310]|nr:MAG: hypothetical protein M1818_002833 [Claussenomyces sp. TS43310]